MQRTFDVIIIGAGIVGLNAAWQIARRTKLSVLVLERASSLGAGSTGASSAICRFRYSRPEMVRLAADGIWAYRNWSRYLKIAMPTGKYHGVGVLWLADGNAHWPQAEAVRLGQYGIRAEVLSDSEVIERFPAIHPCIEKIDFVHGESHICKSAGAHLLEVDGGFFDPMDAVQDLLSVTRANGVTAIFNTQVERVLAESGSVKGVLLASGERLFAPWVINASGPWCNFLNQSAGIGSNWSLQPTRIQIVHVDRPPDMPGSLPVCVDTPAGIYFRPQNQGQQIIVGSILEEDESEGIEDPDTLATYVDDEFARQKLFALEHRLPSIQYRGIQGYSGLYTINRADVHPIVGHTQLDGFLVANGCSGHGFKLGPALGSLLAQIVGVPADEFDTSAPADFLSIKRNPISLASKSVVA